MCQVELRSAALLTNSKQAVCAAEHVLDHAAVRHWAAMCFSYMKLQRSCVRLRYAVFLNVTRQQANGGLVHTVGVSAIETRGFGIVGQPLSFGNTDQAPEDVCQAELWSTRWLSCGRCVVANVLTNSKQAVLQSLTVGGCGGQTWVNFALIGIESDRTAG
jgi:hypothetical protein